MLCPIISSSLNPKKSQREFIDKCNISVGIDFHDDAIGIIDNMAIFNFAFVQSFLGNFPFFNFTLEEPGKENHRDAGSNQGDRPGIIEIYQKPDADKQKNESRNKPADNVRARLRVKIADYCLDNENGTKPDDKTLPQITGRLSIFVA